MNIKIDCENVDIADDKPNTKTCAKCGGDNTRLGINAILIFDDENKTIDFVHVDQSTKYFIYCDDCEEALDI
jgi:hypothetical protein